MGNICKLYIVTMREICLGRLYVTFIHCTDTFYPHFTAYVYYINSLCQPVVGNFFFLLFM